ncbi:tetraspanin-13 [Esox lucius]|uniref:Tetraspanin-13 n=1 Tax=Esox lucius TaxID=8010 RepID=C1BZP8_ESOLU|nr:tetraspanin-13a [Esox lucius]ACO14501.1 Tetraspanin-13 [Esox lucius]
MGCGGFVCTKNSLCALNVLYVIVSLLLIGVGAWGKWFGLVSSFRVVAGVIGVGIFLLFVAFLGLCGALKHHQVLLFFYMLILFLVFIVQLSVSAACLAINKEQQVKLLEAGLKKSPATLKDVERTLNCCGFSEVNTTGTCEADCFSKLDSCDPCGPLIQTHASEVLHFVGGIGCFFSFTEILGVWLTHRYRNQKNSHLNSGHSALC